MSLVIDEIDNIGHEVSHFQLKKLFTLFSVPARNVAPNYQKSVLENDDTF